MEYIKIKNAHVNNLKNIDVEIPKNKLVVITGISGSGKSSLAFDLIFEEGRKKYLQSIGMALEFGENQYTDLTGLSPTVAVKQNLIRQSNPRSTLGSKTGVLNKLSLLFANESSNGDDECFGQVNPSIFSYLSPEGMCFNCGGTGKKFAIHMENIISNDKMTVEEVFKKIGATGGYLNLLARKYKDFFHESFLEIPDDVKHELTYGIVDISSGKTSYCIERVLQNRFLRDENIDEFYSLGTCPTCGGYRISEEAQSFLLDGYHIGQIGNLNLSQLKDYLEDLLKKELLSTFGIEMVNSILKTVGSLVDIKLGHLSLYREIPSLSGGELQRVFLHDHLESRLNSLIYVFDEPTSGLHPSEKGEIINSLQALRDYGNTVIVVSHDKTIIQLADHIIDIGPKAGNLGGEIVFQGAYEDFLKSDRSLTSNYLGKTFSKASDQMDNQSTDILRLDHISKNNLKNLSISLPLNRLVGIAGVSGSGKSSLISKSLVPIVREQLKYGNSEKVLGIENIKNIVEINQAPIGRKSNSNPVSYLGTWDKIRELFALEQKSIDKGLKAGDFSFNSKGACPSCNGSGVELINLGFNIQFEKICPDCGGSRFNDTTLAVQYKGKNISEVLDLSVDEALDFFKASKINLSSLETLEKIGMGYIKLGQPSSTLSGGEAQRIKLAKEIGKIKSSNTLYILDEPSTGLSQYDISSLLYLLDELVDRGNSVILIEHDMDILSHCDWIVELGPEAGEKGGKLIAEGSPSDLKKNINSITGRFL